MAKIPRGHRPIQGTERTPARGARAVGPADPKEVLTVSIRVRRRQDAPPPPGLKDWAANPRGQGRVSREEFAARFGASEADLNLVADFARSNGLAVVESSVARRTVVLSGTVEQMCRAFTVELQRYESPDQTYRGREGPVHLPNDVADVVEGVFGLDNRRMAKRAGGGAPSPPALTPRQVAELYNFPFSANVRDQTIGLFEFGGGYVNSDIQSYFTGQGLTTPALFSVGVDSASNSPGAEDDVEVALDIEVAGAVAQGANIAVYFAPFTEQGWVDIVTTSILGTGLPADWAAPSVISISWAWGELESLGTFAWTMAAINAVNQTFQEAAMLGVTVFAASGDNGSDCQVGDGKAHVYYPASDPWVTTCGGTSVQNVVGNAFTEATWNDNGVTGGGVSDIFPMPYWQEAAGVPGSVNDGHIGRGIPDIAGHADGYSVYLGGAMQDGVRGTSETAPLYAGLMALINAVVADSVGYLNPMLYELGGTYVFRDIADGGSNAVSGAPGYTAGVGWDACTGWGSVDGTALLNAVETLLFAMILPTLDLIEG
jgi:kumamolisin